MNDSGRFWLAAALTPLSVPALFASFSLFSGSGFQTPFVATIAALASGSYIGFLVFGLPFVLLLRAKDKLSYGKLILGGFVAGPLFVILWLVLSAEPIVFDRLYVQISIYFTVLSVTVAMVFGFIAKVRKH